jgi:phthiocerol/phenolphthiocerol synthesis type-I polyketide synthase E
MTSGEPTDYPAGIAVIGMSGVFPGANSVDQFWRNLCDGVESVTFFSDEELLAQGIDPSLLSNPNFVKAATPLPNIEWFDAAFFGFLPREAQLMDPQIRIFIECAWAALENAAYDPQRFKGSVGVYAGAGMNTYLLSMLTSDWRAIRPLGSINARILNSNDFLTTHVSYKLGLEGPSVNVQTACSTSLVAIHTACQSLLNGECDMALAGGVSVNLLQQSGYFYEPGGIASPDGHCRAFDAQARGCVFGSGVGVVVLKRLANALSDGDRIDAVIIGSAINNDGASKVGFTAPGVSGQAQVIAEALSVAEVEPDSISYVEAHGTGTSLGDPIEVAALIRAFGEKTDRKGFCAIGSVKTNVGHLDAAAGVTGLIKSVLALKHKKIPPSLNFEQPNPQIDFEHSPFYVNTRLSDWPSGPTPRRAGVSSFGIGGTNAHVIVEEAPAAAASDAAHSDWHLLVLSAKTPTALDAATQNLAAHLKQHPNIDLADAAYTCQLGRKEFTYRRALVCRDVDDAVETLETHDPKRLFTGCQELDNPPAVFLFPGQGTQHVNMGLELYQTEPVFRAQVDSCAALLVEPLGLDLREVLYPGGDADATAKQDLNQTWLAQPALFVTEYALAQLLISWGVHPQAMIGHSVGEYVAACLAGVFTLEEALQIVAVRGKLMQSQPAGAMVAVNLSEEAVQPLLGPHLSLAAVNGAAQCVVSGSVEDIERLIAQLAERRVAAHRLHTSHAFHSSMMDSIVEPFVEQVKKARPRPPRINFISNVTGEWITAAEATDPAYWGRHLRQTVRFASGVQQFLKEPELIMLEVGPGRTLNALIRPHIKGAGLLLSTLPGPKATSSEVQGLLEVLARLWLAGTKIDWAGLYPHERRRRIPLPTYPFERQYHWADFGKAKWPSGEAQAPSHKVELPADVATAHSSPDSASDSISASGIQPNEVERSIVALWQELLGIERIDVNDNFFELGGHSLLATQLLYRLQEMFAANMSLSELLGKPTVAGMAETVEMLRRSSAHPSTGPVDLNKEAVLDSAIRGNGYVSEAQVADPDSVLLTGATGFLGAFLLDELLEKTKASIHCLVRASDAQEGYARIQSNLQAYSLWDESKAARIIPVLGDLSKPLLDLSPEQFQALAEKVDVIYHNGASVKHTYPYALLKAPNVLGTHEILRLAAQHKTKPVHFISTMAVFSPISNWPEDKVVREQYVPQQDKGLFNGYVESKFVAEKLVMLARANGIPVSIYRVDRVGGDSQTGACQTDDFLWRMAKSCIQIESIPDLDIPLPLAPVDYVIKAIVYLSQQIELLGQTFHVVNPNFCSVGQIAASIRSLGYQVETIPFEQWMVKLRSIAAEGTVSNAAYSLMPFLNQVSEILATRSEAARHENPEAFGRNDVRFDCRYTLDKLAGTSITCPRIDDRLLRTYFTYFINNGFLERPRDIAHSTH